MPCSFKRRENVDNVFLMTEALTLTKQMTSFLKWPCRVYFFESSSMPSSAISQNVVAIAVCRDVVSLGPEFGRNPIVAFSKRFWICCFRTRQTNSEHLSLFPKRFPVRHVSRNLAQVQATTHNVVARGHVRIPFYLGYRNEIQSLLIGDFSLTRKIVDRKA